MPLTVFLLDYCIRYPTITLTDVAANELEVGGEAVIICTECGETLLINPWSLVLEAIETAKRVLVLALRR